MRSLRGGDSSAATKSSLADIEKRKKGRGKKFISKHKTNGGILVACEKTALERKEKLTVLFKFEGTKH